MHLDISLGQSLLVNRSGWGCCSVFCSTGSIMCGGRKPTKNHDSPKWDVGGFQSTKKPLTVDILRVRREFGKVALVDMLNSGTTKAAVPGGRDPERQNKCTEKIWLGFLVNFETILIRWLQDRRKAPQNQSLSNAVLPSKNWHSAWT